MDVSIYSMNEILWIDFLENSYNIVEEPIMGNIFEDVTDLFQKYFKKSTYYNDKSVVKNVKKDKHKINTNL
jgi:hypothetical protein